MKKHINPFRPTRWEHHSEDFPLIWFTPTSSQLAQDKSVYVNGSRGSGKTTLLRSICWEDLLTNPSLKLQKSINDFKYIGVYIRLPDHVSESMSYLDWKQIFPNIQDTDLEFYRFFSLAVELICIEKCASAVHSLRLKDCLEISATEEARLIADLTSEFPGFENFNDTPPRNLLELSKLCRTMVRTLNQSCARGHLAHTVGLYPAREPNQLLSYFVEHLSKIARLRSEGEAIVAGFKFCLDDCEVLSPLQRKSINSLVRKSSFPVSWVVCSVGDFIESADTFTPNQPLTDADRLVLSLYKREKAEFYQLCQAVSGLRLYFNLIDSGEIIEPPEDISSFFKLEQRLGTASVNDMLVDLLNRSISQEAEELLKAATLLQEAIQDDKIHKYPDRFYSPNSALPVYEAFILSQWDSSISGQLTSDRASRILDNHVQLATANGDAAIRRKMVSVLLYVAQRFGHKRIPLSGSGVITMLADGSIRDFLEIMAEIYDKHARESIRTGTDPNNVLSEFVRQNIPISRWAQTMGIYASSFAFFRGIGSATDTTSAAMSKIIEFLARYTAKLQANIEFKRGHISTSERGVFIVRNSSQESNAEYQGIFRELLHRAELSGYLRTSIVGPALSSKTTDPDAKPIIGYRLHRRFAPFFGFSYRGAYEPLKISEEIFIAILENPSISVRNWVSELSGLTDDDSAQLMLPFDLENMHE